jgi:hypothetical protein
MVDNSREVGNLGVPVLSVVTPEVVDLPGRLLLPLYHDARVAAEKPQVKGNSATHRRLCLDSMHKGRGAGPLRGQSGNMWFRGRAAPPRHAIRAGSLC